MSEVRTSQDTFSTKIHELYSIVLLAIIAPMAHTSNHGDGVGAELASSTTHERPVRLALCVIWYGDAQ